MFALARPAGLLDQPSRRRDHEPGFFDLWSHGGPEPSVSFIGPLDARNAADAAPHLQLALSEAADRVTVDLTEVSLLASAGVDVLFQLVDQARSNDVTVTILAPNGSPAQQVLSLVGLPHTDPGHDDT